VGSKRLVKSLADILVISLRIKTGSQRGHKQLILSEPFNGIEQEFPRQGRAKDSHPDIVPHTGQSKTVRSNS
jgi:hypothetical protein